MGKYQLEIDGETFEVEGEGIDSPDAAYQAFVGNAETPEDLPELFNRKPGGVPRNMRRGPQPEFSMDEKISAALAFTTSPEEQAAIVLKFMPDAEITEADGQVRVTGVHPETGEELDGFVDKKGLSKRNIDQVGALGLLFTPGGRAANLISRGGIIGGVGRGLTTASMEGMTEAGRQYLVRQFNPDVEVPYDPNSIAMSAAGGAMGEAAGSAISWLTKTVRNPFYVKGGELTEKGKKLFREAGIDPALVEDNPELLMRFKRTAGLPETARNRGLTESRPDLLVQTQTTGVARPSVEGLREASEVVKNQAMAGKLSVDKAYSTALQFDASMNQASLGKAIDQVRTSLAQQSFPITDGAPKRLLKDLQTTVMEAKDLGDVGQGSLRAYEIWRKKANKKKRDLGAKKASEKAAIGVMVQEMDQHVLAMFRDGLVRGDPQSINLWNRAIARSAEYTKKFNANNIIDTISREKLVPDDVAKILYRTRGKVTERAEAIQGLKEIVGEKSEAFQNFKSEYLSQIFQQGQKSFDTFDPEAFGRNFTKLLREEPTVLKSFLDKDEIKILKDLARITPTDGRSTLLAGVADLISLRYGVQGNAIAGSFRRTANRINGIVETERPMLASVGAVAGAASGSANLPQEFPQSE